MDYKPIPDFPGYSVSRYGNIRNDDTGRVLVLTRNQHGIIQVGLMRHGIQYKRSVAVLVAHAFLDPPALEAFDTPIHLDGDKSNCNYGNLMWRPRWFAVKYHRQFDLDPVIPHRVIELTSKMKFRTSRRAATLFGILEEEILDSARHRTFVWPTYQQFRILD